MSFFIGLIELSNSKKNIKSHALSLSCRQTSVWLQYLQYPLEVSVRQGFMTSVSVP